MASPFSNAFRAAVIFTAAGVLTAGCMFGFPRSRNDFSLEFIAHAGLATFPTALFVWGRLVNRPGKPGMRHGAIAGFVISIIAHPVTWYLFICTNWFLVLLSIRDGPSGGDDVLNPITGLMGTYAYSLVSLIVAGWITAPVGALVGAFVALISRESDVQENGPGSE